MIAIETETVEQDGHTYRIAIYPDGDTPNPLDDWSEMGSILSLNRRHANFDPGGIEAAIDGNPDAVALSYFEHGLCCWSVAGELPAANRSPFDSVSFAGIWLPDAETLESARRYGGSTRRHFMRQRAGQACDVYTQWCNGDIYGYDISRIVACPDCHGDRLEPVDSCWGFYGLEACRAEAKTMLATCGHRAA
ncbi:hypothetical protein [Singulisphaera acidiphila]|uniref:Uncharacterized protein n=1 Tax=Singulisphaera acidiphila (strain ATCC BAA-1392 / DSM 18658 / VKM B-2454 / MOB10) TaxID=886293 RepID=L0DQI4_SINAD|nr:hypothetical protein [Singulisphaera acidiphila]AGA31714.1 hypothetical protein Sinac_7686 [Singulisphaera acidiphila DSM 18658]